MAYIHGNSPEVWKWLKEQLDIDVYKTPIMGVTINITPNALVVAEVRYELTEENLNALKIKEN